jgi:MFS family permease
MTEGVETVFRNPIEVSKSAWEILSRPVISILVGGILSFWAGSINTTTTLAVFFERASHVSGRLNDVGMNAVLEPAHGLLVLVIWIGFSFGGFLAGMLLDRIGLTRSLLLIAGSIGIATFLVYGGVYVVNDGEYPLARYLIAFYLPITMGYQNAITTLLPIGRSTHWTGDSTDLGIAVAKRNYLFAFRNLFKIFGFICGAAIMGYLIGLAGLSPLHGLVLITTGYFFTAIVLSLANRIFVNRAHTHK